MSAKLNQNRLLQVANSYAPCCGNVAAIARVTQLPETTVRRYLDQARRREMLPTLLTRQAFPDMLPFEVRDGTVLVGSDAHYWPGPPTTAHQAFVAFAKEYKPKAIIMNGDVLDGATLSRFARIGWETPPSLKKELDVCQDRLDEIYRASKNSKRFWPLGNHDGRFESKIANELPEYAKVTGIHLKDHFPMWEPCWSVCLTNQTIVKHRFKGGLHATHNNALWGGMHMVTGHLHQLRVTPLRDYRGRRYGVDCGMLADVYGDQFRNYTEQNPVNWESGFVLLTFRKGVMLQPELVVVVGPGEVDFRGQIITV